MLNFINQGGEILAKGGILVGPIATCSIIALGIFLERVYRLSKTKIRGQGVVSLVTTNLRKGDYDKSMQCAKELDTPMSRVLLHALEVLNQ
ncbi:MAG: hypothetical protein OEV64_13560, partial [Desulfobulbaceae bacterium]|nr:hypothetical protein [Desulfobulbaceae bacterium]